MWTVFAFCAVAIATSSAYDNNDLFESFRVQFKKDYHPKEVAYRRAVFLDNVDYINKHNELEANGTYTFTLGVNEYADMTNLEFTKFMNGFKPEPSVTSQEEKFFIPTGKSLPKHVDWREEGWVSAVKNQKQCGSCWAFSTTGALEAQHYNRTRKMVTLSEQNLMDCSTIYGNRGCQGGWPYNAMKYVIYNKGIDTEASYPYTARNGVCHFMRDHVGSTCETYRFVRPGDEVGLQEAVAEIGPVSVAIDAAHRSFQLYRSGVYYEPACSPRKLDHAVLVVGYGTWENQRYWLVKNSWGTYWGLEGYIRMSRFMGNQCGIATVAVYPLLK